MKKFYVFLITIFFIFFGINVKAEISLAESAKSAILIEASTGKVLFEKNSHERRVPASMTKMMSMLLIIENIEKGVINWDDIVTVSANASSMGGSQILLEENEQMSVRDLFKGIAVASGNDAVVALAEKIGGSVENFVSMMNTKAKELGLKDTNFKNPHGLDAAEHYSSAYDMSLIARELSRHEVVFEYTSIYEDYLRKDTDRKIWLVNTNKLVRFYPGVDGLKTGYTEEAGYCLTATAKRDNLRVIAVVMGEEDSKTRNQEITEMLDYAFSQYKVTQVLNKNSEIGKINIRKAKKKKADLSLIEDINILSKKIDGNKDINYEIITYDVKAPIKKGEVVGKIKVKVDNDTLEYDLTVKEDIKKAGLFELFIQNLEEIFNQK